MPARRTASAITRPAMSSGRTDDNPPRKRPPAVLTALTIAMAKSRHVENLVFEATNGVKSSLHIFEFVIA